MTSYISADWWGRNSEPGICQCCQRAAPVYRGYTGGQDLAVRLCWTCKSSTHEACQAESFGGRR